MTAKVLCLATAAAMSSNRLPIAVFIGLNIFKSWYRHGKIAKKFIYTSRCY
jgi:hypothetical protein